MPKAANRNGYASRVNILKYVKVANKWRFAPAQLVNGKLKFDLRRKCTVPPQQCEPTVDVKKVEGQGDAVGRAGGVPRTLRI